MRKDPLRQTWTVFAPERAKQAGRTKPQATTGNHPFGAGHEHLLTRTLLNKGNVRVIPNRAPILRVEGDPAILGDGIYDRMEGVGAHEIIIETPSAKPLELLAMNEIETVIDAWKVRMLDLTKDKRLRAFFVIKDCGTSSGAAYDHALSQLLAFAIIPLALRQKLDVAADFFQRRKHSIFGNILDYEESESVRMVYENNGFAAFCPYASRSPFEVAIYPKRQCADFHGITDQERAQFADVLRNVLQRLNSALGESAYHFSLTTAPARTERRDQWNTLDLDFRWHVEIVPRVEVQTGFDLATGCALNTVLPEVAAKFLREIAP